MIRIAHTIKVFLAFAIIFLVGIFLFFRQSDSHPVTAAGNTYYVSTTGNNSNSGTIDSPFLTVSYAVTQLDPGDTLYVREGTYEESLENEIPSGTSWDVPVTVAAYPGEKPVLQPAATVDRVLMFSSVGGIDSYIIVDGLVLDGTNIDFDNVKITLGSHHIRIINCEIRNGPQNGILTTQDGSDFNEFIDNDIHDNGDASGEHGIYVSSEDNLIDGNRSYNNAESGIKINGNSSNIENNVVRNNIVYDQGTGIMLTVAGPGTEVYNNIVFGNGWGIYIRVGANGVRAYNNTTYKNTHGIYIYETADDIVVSNNIASENTTYGIYVASTASNITLSNNLSADNTTNFEDLGSVATSTNNLIGDSYDADLTDPDTFDFTLLSTSDAINNGTTISVVTTDIRDAVRPNGTAYDIGAYEFYSTYASPQSGSSPWVDTHWVNAVGSPIATSYSSISLGNALTLSQTNHISNSGFDVNTTGWTPVIEYTGNEPDDITELQLWFKADAITGVSDGGAISTWPDSSGNARNATQTTAAAQPTLQTNELNGKPIVRTDGSDDYFNISPAYSITDDITIYWVEKRGTDSLSDRSIIGRGISNGDTYLGFNQSSTVHRISFRRHGQTATNTQLASLISGDSYNIWGLHQSGTTAKVYRNGANGINVASFTAPSAAFDIGYLLARRPNLNMFRGDIAEIIVYNRALTDDEIDYVEAYLNSKYALEITSPYATETRGYTNKYQGAASATITATTYNTNYITTANPNTTGNLILRGYVYDAGNTVDATDAQLFHNGSAIATTYTSVDDGWYELSATVAGSTSSTSYGIQVKAGKTLELDNIQLLEYATSGTLTSSIFNMGPKADLGTMIFSGSLPASTSYTVKVRTGDQSDLSGAVSFTSCSGVSSGANLLNGTCTPRAKQYVQYEITFTTTDTSVTPSFYDITIPFTNDATSPTSDSGFGQEDPPDNAVVNDSSPTFRWHKATDAGVGIAKYQIVLEDSTGRVIGHIDNVNPEKPSNVDYRETDEMYIFYDGNYIQAYTKLASHFLADGTYKWRVRAEDYNGNVLESGWRNITIKTTFSSPSPSPTATSSGTKKVIKKKTPAATASPTPQPEDFEIEPVGLPSPAPTPTTSPTIPGYKVEVRVLDEEQQPVAGANVEIHSDPQYGTTDRNGLVTFSNVPAGTHTLLVAYDGSSGEQKIEVLGDTIANNNFVIQLKTDNPFKNVAVVGVILSLVAVIATLLLVIVKQKKSTNKSNVSISNT